MAVEPATATRPSRFVLWYGRDEPPPEHCELHAGQLVAQLDGPDLRHVRVGSLEVLRRLYVGVRDRNWSTIPPELSNLAVESRGDGFVVTFDARHRSADLDFRWHGLLRGRPDGCLECTLDGTAGNDFVYGRIGFCLLHPLSFAGSAYCAQTPGGQVCGLLPREIGPQRIENGRVLPLFPSYDALTLEAPGAGTRIEFHFDGDLFEMEDQRNWTDASFKTYSTPLALGLSHTARAGQRIVQTVTMSVTGAPPAADSVADDIPTVSLGPKLGRRLPPIGLGIARGAGRLSPREVELLRALRPGHLRADLDLGSEWQAELERAVEQCAELSTDLELALTLRCDPEAELDAVAAALALLDPPLARLLVFHAHEPVTTGRWLRLARNRIPPGTPVVGGTNLYFTDLNRARLELDEADGVAYSLHPQEHAHDDETLIENLEGQAETVRSARLLCGDTPVHVTPVTLRRRLDPAATGPELAPGELPTGVDARQPTLLAAAWTAGSAKALAESGAASITYYETTGARGVLDTGVEPPQPEPCPSLPGDVYPMYHVLADLAEWRAAELLAADSTDAEAIQALALDTGEALHVLVANLRPSCTTCSLEGWPAGTAGVRALDDDSAERALVQPDAFRRDADECALRNDRLELQLRPYAIVRLDTMPTHR
jgi:hypothetical protein